FDNREVAHGNLFRAVLPGHADAALGTAAAAVAGIRRDRPALAIALLDAVAATQSLKIVPLHYTRVATTLTGTADVHCLPLLEDFADGQPVANFVLARFVEAEFTNVPLRLAIGLGGQRSATLLSPFRFQVRRDVTAFCSRRFTPRLVQKAKLQGIVAVAF